MPSVGEPPKVCVLGSINMDLVVRSPVLPTPGQTVMADSYAQHFGGKGANQAIAAARAGADVVLVGRVGDDTFAPPLCENLKANRVDSAAVLKTPNTSSGVAVIAVDDDGENCILVVAGANAALSVEDVEVAAERIETADVLLVQLEVPLDAVRAAMAIARRARVPVVLDPAPVPKAGRLPDDLLQVDLLCPNETEASQLSGVAVRDVESARNAAEILHRRGAAHVAVTLGAAGTSLFDGREATVIPSLNVTPVDTTAAGDSLAGAAAAEWRRSGNLLDAIRYGNVAGALATTRDGAQSSIPTDEEIRRRLGELGPAVSSPKLTTGSAQ